jgi:hypothetical protein
MACITIDSIADPIGGPTYQWLGKKSIVVRQDNVSVV